MSKHDPLVSMRQMRDAAREAVSFTAGVKRRDLEADRKLSLALVQLLLITGEAAARVKPEERLRFPAIPWPSIVGLRNELIHGYDSINYDLVWQILTVNVPELLKHLDEYIAD